MKNKDWKMNTRVAVMDGHDARFGTIVGTTNHPDFVIVEFDSIGDLKKIDIQRLRTEAEGQKEVQRLKDKKARLEEEFEIARQEIADKMREAAKLIDESDQLAHKNGISLPDMWNEVGPLTESLSSAGWNTSLWSC